MLDLRGGGFAPELLARGDTHRKRIFANGWTGSLLPLLSQLKRPSLWLRGEYDPVTPPDLVAEFRATVPDGEVRAFADTAHYVHLEAPTAYADAVTDFVLDTRDR